MQTKQFLDYAGGLQGASMFPYGFFERAALIDRIAASLFPSRAILASYQRMQG
jgi:hypothetical protein